MEWLDHAHHPRREINADALRKRRHVAEPGGDFLLRLLRSAPLSAKTAAEAIRSHWGIENRNHYVRDVSMLEDASRIRTNPGIFARARSFALNILRANSETNIADALWRNPIDFNRILKYRYL